LFSGQRFSRYNRVGHENKEQCNGEAKNSGIRILRVKDTDDLPTIYAKRRKAFTAADLQKFTEIEEGIPFEQVLAEMKAIHREETAKLKKKKKTSHPEETAKLKKKKKT